MKYWIVTVVNSLPFAGGERFQTIGGPVQSSIRPDSFPLSSPLNVSSAVVFLPIIFHVHSLTFCGDSEDYFANGGWERSVSTAVHSTEVNVPNAGPWLILMHFGRLKVKYLLRHNVGLVQMKMKRIYF